MTKSARKPAAQRSAGKKAAAPKAATKTTKPTAARNAAKNAPVFWKPLTKRERDGRPAVTPRLIKTTERLLGIRLPAALLKLLRQQNGGYLVHPEFLVGGHAYELEDLPSLGVMGSLAAGYSDHLELAEGRLPKPEWLFPLCGDGHWFLALDYRTVGPQGEPEIVYLDIEGRVSCKKVAASFDQFLAGQQTGTQRLAVSFDEIDPDTLIGQVDLETTHKAGRETKVTYQARLCLTDSQVILYTYERWDQPRKKSTETWERSVAKLRELLPDWVNIKKRGGYFPGRTKTLYVYATHDLGGTRGMTGGVDGIRCEREGTGGWKNRPVGPVLYLSMTAKDVPLLEKCRDQILNAYRRQKRS